MTDNRALTSSVETLECRDDPGLARRHTPRRHPCGSPRPLVSESRLAWGRLYAILPVTGLLCAAVFWCLPEGFWRTTGAYGIGATTITLFALWIASNRHVLAGAGTPPDLAPLRVVYVYLPVRPWRSAHVTDFPSSLSTLAEFSPAVVGPPPMFPVEAPRS